MTLNVRKLISSFEKTCISFKSWDGKTIIGSKRFYGEVFFMPISIFKQHSSRQNVNWWYFLSCSSFDVNKGTNSLFYLEYQ